MSAGIRKVIQPIYNNVLRPALPSRWVTYNGVAVPNGKVLDSTTSHPEYDAEICDIISTLLRPGDDVLVIGEKMGVKTVHIANATGATGQIQIFEGNAEYINQIESVLRRNEVAADVHIEQYLVGTALNPDEHDGWGGVHNRGGTDYIDVSELPAADAIVLNTAGTELEILSNLPNEYRTVITKTYDNLVPGYHDAAETILSCEGYEVAQMESQTDDIKVIGAELR